MNITSSTLPPVNSQPHFNNEAGRNAGSEDDRNEGVREVFAELIDENNLSVPVTAVLEPAETEPPFGSPPRFLSERVDLNRFAKTDNLPLINQQALASYQTVINNTPVADTGIARLDIFV